MQYIFGLILFLFGSALGSFILVIANRYNTGLPCVKGRSICFSCNTQLQNKDLVPIFSFLFLKGKCRHCQSKIPKEVFVTEILMGVLSVLAALKSGFLIFSDFPLILNTYPIILFINYLLLLLIFAVILLISIYDLRHFIIPDAFLIIFFVLSFVYILIPIFLNFSLHLAVAFGEGGLLLTTSSLLLLNILSGIILALPFLLIFIISKGRWLGFGDVKYILVLGFFLGFIQGLSAVILAFWIGAIFSLILLSLKYLKRHFNLPLLSNNFTIKSEIPFGPFLSLGIIISFYLNADIFQIHSLFNAF